MICVESHPISRCALFNDPSGTELKQACRGIMECMLSSCSVVVMSALYHGVNPFDFKFMEMISLQGKTNFLEKSASD